MTNEFISASDLFGNYRLIKEGKPLNERATLIAYFVKEIGREPKLMGIRLAHYNIGQLYALKSSYEDRVRRNDKTTADKYFWALTRTQKAA